MTNQLTVAENQLPMELVECVKESVIATFEIICGGGLTFQGDVQSETPGDSINGVIGIISLVGDVAWSLMVGLPTGTATALSAKFAGFEIPFNSSDMGDVVAELANVLAGDVSARLDEIGVKTDLSLPTAARGTDIDMLLPGMAPTSCMRFASPDGDFWVKIAAASPKHIRRSGG